jgi:hypothetical protein
MPFAVLYISSPRVTVGRFSLSGPKDLKDRISLAFLHDHDQRIQWNGQAAGIMGSVQMVSSSCEVHALLNVIEASGWKLTHMTESRYIFEKL